MQPEHCFYTFISFQGWHDLSPDFIPIQSFQTEPRKSDGD